MIRWALPSILDAGELRAVGGKAFNLGRISALGEAVPEGIVIGNEYFNRELVLREDLRALLRAWWSTRRPGTLIAVRSSASAARALGWSLLFAGPL